MTTLGLNIVLFVAGFMIGAIIDSIKKGNPVRGTNSNRPPTDEEKRNRPKPTPAPPHKKY